jgi:RsiW-degrading membrane proteinase PrsW (M82 family)
MSETALHGLALGLAIAGMAAFALSLDGHWRLFAGSRPLSGAARLGIRAAGGSLLAAAFVACLAADPPTMAVLVWTTLLTIAAGLVAAAVTIRASRRAG